MGENRREYWASVDSERIGKEIYDRFFRYYQYLRHVRRLELWIRSYETYYSGSQAAGDIEQAGSSGELSKISVNHYRSLIQAIIGMTTAPRATWEPRAVNTDYKSQSQTVLCQGILEYAMRAKHAEVRARESLESAMVVGDGYTSVTWDPNLGDDYSVDPGSGEPGADGQPVDPSQPPQTVKSGDILYRSHTPFDVARDMNRDRGETDAWVTVRSYRNRYDLIAKYPTYADQILSATGRYEDPQIEWSYNIASRNYFMDSDDVAVFEFYHGKSDAMPNGRLTLALANNTVIFDGALPYKEIPVYRIAVSDQLKTALGYSTAYDLLALQKAHSALHSIIVSNQSAFGVQNILVPKGGDITIEHLRGGMNLLQVAPQLIEFIKPLNLTNTPPEIFKYLDQTQHALETISGVNSVARGNPSENIKSGTAMALVQSMALQANDGVKQAWVRHIEDVGTATVNVYKTFAKAPQTAYIVGKMKKPLLKEFTGEDLSDIDRVTVDFGSALSQNAAGRLQIADNLLQNHLIKTAQEYLQVLNTGRLEAMTEGDTAALLNVRAENEKLAQGQSVTASITDDPKLHIVEHGTVLASPEVRDGTNPEALQVTLAHIMDHLDKWSGTPPPLAALLGFPPPPPPPMPPPGVGPPGPMGGPLLPSGPPGPHGGPPPGAGAVMAPPEAPHPRNAKLPKNPMTGQPAVVPTLAPQ